MKFKYDFLTQTDLGKLFGVTSHEIGKWLQRIGLRNEDKTPSDKALSGNFVAILPCRNEHQCYSWNTQKTVKELENAGYKKIPNPTEYLVEHEDMDGPYEYVRNSSHGYDITSTSTGIVNATVYGLDNAKIVTEALNIYDRCMKKKASGGTP